MIHLYRSLSFFYTHSTICYGDTFHESSFLTIKTELKKVTALITVAMKTHIPPPPPRLFQQDHPYFKVDGEGNVADAEQLEPGQRWIVA